MKIVNTIQEVRENVKAWRTEGLTVGFVPTMGYLHEGHQSLIHRAAKENDRVVVSIFINPLQFGEKEDLETYPRDLERDSIICAAAGTDLIFHPTAEEMYDGDFCSFVDVNGLTDTLCGKSRPGHFRGVCTVVAKLFNIVKPDRAYFGQKDAQQVAVIKRMVRDLNMDLEIIACETVREADGLAKSSRNVHLNKEERRASTILQGALRVVEKKLAAGTMTSEEIQKTIVEKIASETSVRLDYAEVVDLETLRPVSRIEAPALIAAAVYVGKTRLIDNFIYSTL
ncbi:MAG TPA: pantoate--beta-alanine ligase [Anaerovoracaceae bacterium]|nr:pantoate--beta-alanine ligase [Anaerovoracaceae bacterium]